ncbi:hypothetical protein HMPREF0262_00392 [Clostridium sp. ATCC 29733]|nr:hypothetical protein HMPREF0262_00392 [Clostridium sp. ATCC 29733]
MALLTSNTIHDIGEKTRCGPLGQQQARGTFAKSPSRQRAPRRGAALLLCAVC